MSERVGHRQTRQREAIFDTIAAAPGPLTVREIHEGGARRVDGLGIATVYRTLRLLLDEGRLRPVNLPSGETRYETADLGHHHHFHCRRCDSVFDLEECPVRIPTPRDYPGGFIVEDHELTLFGTCPTCSGSSA